MWYKVFTDLTTGKKLLAYSLYGEAFGEEAATKGLLAYENKIDEKDILISLERRMKDGVYYYIEDGLAECCDYLDYVKEDFTPEEMRELIKNPAAQEKDFIRFVANYEKTLIRYEMKNNERVDWRVIYDPYA